MSLPWFRFNAQQWLGDIRYRRLSIVDKAAFIELASYMWSGANSNGPRIENDDEDIALLLGLSAEEWKASKRRLCGGEEPIFSITDCGRYLYSEDLREQHRKAKAEQEKRSEKGRAMAEARWNKENKKAKGQEASEPESESDSGSAKEVFEHCKTTANRGWRLTDGLRRKIRTRLKTYSVDDLKKAFDNIRTSDFHTKNDYATPVWLFHSDERVDKWLNHKPEVRRNGVVVDSYIPPSERVNLKRGWDD